MDDFAAQVRGLVVATDEYRRVMAGATGTGVLESAAIGELRARGPLPPSALAERLGIASASMTAMLDRLTLAGLLVRRPHPRDRRSLLVELTPHGHATIGAAFDVFREDVLLAVDGLAPDEVRALGGALERVVAALRERIADPSLLAERIAAVVGAAGLDDTVDDAPDDTADVDLARDPADGTVGGRAGDRSRVTDPEAEPSEPV